MSTRPQSQRFYSALEQPIQDSRPSFPPTPPPKEPHQVDPQRRQSTALSLMSVMGEQMKGYPPYGGMPSERPRGGAEPRIAGLPFGAAVGSVGSLVQDVGLPRRGKEIRKGTPELESIRSCSLTLIHMALWKDTTGCTVRVQTEGL